MNIFEPHNFIATRRPLLEAEPLPNYCYTSPEWYRREVEAIFLKEWLLIGRAEQIPKAGDYFVEEIVGEAVLVVRGADGAIRAFSPFCRHRGTRFASGQGTCRVFTCPYHGWAYNLDGTLRAAPSMTGVKDFAAVDYGLVPIRMETWQGFVFVNFSADAEDLTAFLGDLPRHFEKYRLPEMVLTRQKTYRIAANWKFYVDNSQEVYHVPLVHAKTIQNVGPMNTWFFESSGGAYMMLYGRFAGSLSLLKGDVGFPAIEGMDLAREERHELPWLYPNTHFLGTVDTFWWLTMFPEGPGQTRITVNSTFHKSVVDRADFDELAAKYYRRLDITNVEDNDIVELQQKGAELRNYVPGRFSALEQNVHIFANYVLDRVVGGNYAERYALQAENRTPQRKARAAAV